MDSGVGGSGIGLDGIPESDDDNAFYDKKSDLTLYIPGTRMVME